MKITNMSIGYTIRKLRTRQNKSQQEIADLLNIDRKTYVNWENDQNDIKSEYIPTLASIFKVEIKIYSMIQILKLKSFKTITMKVKKRPS